jgi:hypothetical protein
LTPVRDLLSYRPEHFLLFSPEVYFSLFADGNARPLALAGSLGSAGLILAAVLMTRTAAAVRLAGLALALAWTCVAIDYFAGRYQQINWAAVYLVPVAAVAALGFAVIAAAGGRGAAHDRPSGWGARVARHMGVALAVYAVLLHPFVPLLTGRPLAEAELVSLAPDPTAILSLGFVLATQPNAWPGLLLAAPLLLLVISSATLATMRAPEAAVPLAAVVLGVLALIMQRRGGRETQAHPFG